jgi:hypothetical protein
VIEERLKERKEGKQSRKTRAHGDLQHILKVAYATVSSNYGWHADHHTN